MGRITSCSNMGIDKNIIWQMIMKNILSIIIGLISWCLFITITMLILLKSDIRPFSNFATGIFKEDVSSQANVLLLAVYLIILPISSVFVLIIVNCLAKNYNYLVSTITMIPICMLMYTPSVYYIMMNIMIIFILIIVVKNRCSRRPEGVRIRDNTNQSKMP